MILGEPGLGKSQTLAMIGRALGAETVRASSFSHASKPAGLVGKGTLLVDGLDELASRRDGDALERIFAKLQEAGPKRFILTCRSREWTAFTERGVAWAEPMVDRLEPFDRSDALKFLRQRRLQASPEDIVAHLDNSGLADLYGNPLTLTLIAEIADAGEGLPKNRSQLFALACAQLIREHDGARAPGELAKLDEDTALDAAGAAMASLLLAGADRIADVTTAPAGAEDISIAEISKLPLASQAAATLGSKLFVSGGSGFLRPFHRVIAEYLGARWLTRASLTEKARRRLYAALTPGGTVPASLRGLHAWLVHHDERFAARAIETDPYGLIRHGDVSELSDSTGRDLIERLLKLGEDNPWFRATDWGAAPLGGLMRPSLVEPIRDAITSNDTSFHPRSLILESLEGSEIVPDLSGDLEKMLVSRDTTFHERAAAADALQHLWTPAEALERIGTLAELGDENSTRLARELVEQTRFDVPPCLMVRVIMADAGVLAAPVPRQHDRRDRMARLNNRLIARISEIDAPPVLDGMAGYLAMKPQIHWVLCSDLAEIMATLASTAICGGLVGPEDAGRVWAWLVAIHQLDRHRDDEIGLLRAALQKATVLRQSIQDYALAGPLQGEGLLHADYDLGKHYVALTTHREDTDRLLLALDPARRLEPSMRTRFKDCARLAYWPDGFSDAAEEFVEDFIDGDQEYEAFIRKLKDPPLTGWRMHDHKRKRKSARRNAKHHERRRRAFRTRSADLRAGDPAVLFNPARVFVGRIGTSDEETDPYRRVAQWTDDDIADDFLVGLEEFIKANPMIEAAMVAEDLAQNAHLNWREIVFAAMVARERAGQGYEDLSPSRRSAMIMLCHDHSATSMNHELLGKALERLEAQTIAAHEDRRAFIRSWLQPSIDADRMNMPGLYMMAREEPWRQAAAPVAAQWLESNPRLSPVTEAELIDILVAAGLRTRLASISRLRSKETFPDHDRMLSWLAIDVTTRFDEVVSDLGSVARENPDFIWFLRNRCKPDRSQALVGVSVHAAAWIIGEFRTLWPFRTLEGSGSGNENGYDATNFLEALVARLAGDLGPHAVAALAKLAAAPADSYTPPLRLAQDRQRQAIAARKFRALGPGDIDALLTDGPPASVTDLMAIVLDVVADAQARIAGDDLDSVTLFWADDGLPRDENTCRDRLAGMISSQLEQYEIYRQTEADMPAGKRVDLAFSHKKMQLPCEVKSQWHKDVWDAASGQLDDLYLKDWRSGGKGVYVVFWFGDLPSSTGKRVKAHPDGEKVPATAEEFAEMLSTRVPPERSNEIAIVVVDCTR